jgi:hypothetical protein
MERGKNNTIYKKVKVIPWNSIRHISKVKHIFKILEIIMETKLSAQEENQEVFNKISRRVIILANLDFNCLIKKALI